MPDPADRAQMLIEQRESIREQQRLDRQRQELRGLTITDCEDCGETIPAERKQRMPTASRCLCCQEAHELKQRTQGRAR